METVSTMLVEFGRVTMPRSLVLSLHRGVPQFFIYVVQRTRWRRVEHASFVRSVGIHFVQMILRTPLLIGRL